MLGANGESSRKQLQEIAMTDLAGKKCEACRPGAPEVNREEAEAFMSRLPGWDLVREGEIRKLRRAYPFDSFAEALAFTNAVGRLAEAEDHHPSLLTEWGQVTVTWWTHAVKGLHLNDFIMAARTDKLRQAPTRKA
jgi:4a-hydroxytetrahydrobiopterin dehydratase